MDNSSIIWLSVFMLLVIAGGVVQFYGQSPQAEGEAEIAERESRGP